jgi:hypothetical protein
MWVLEFRELFGIEGQSLSNEANATEREGPIVRRRQLAFLLQVLVETLTDATVGSISAYQNIALDH